jgi:hypothetical protein
MLRAHRSRRGATGCTGQRQVHRGRQPLGDRRSGGAQDDLQDGEYLAPVIRDGAQQSRTIAAVFQRQYGETMTFERMFDRIGLVIPHAMEHDA